MTTRSEKRLCKILTHLNQPRLHDNISKNKCNNSSTFRILIPGGYYPYALRIHKYLQSLGHNVTLLPDTINFSKDFLFHLKNERNDYDGLLCPGGIKCSETVIKSLPNLKVISKIGSGTDSIDKTFCKLNNIKVTNVPPSLCETVADLVIGVILATCRNIVTSSNILRKNGIAILDKRETSGCRRFTQKTKDLHSSVVGLIGLGNIGRQVSKRLAFGFGSTVYYTEAIEVGRLQYDRSYGAKYVETLEELLRISDIVVVCCPLLPTTKKMFNEKTFKMMKKDAIFINTARGGIVDTDALIRALKSGKILQAGLDVTDPEPLPINHELFKLSNVTITPHIGTNTVQCRNKMVDLAAENLLNVLNKQICTNIVV
eukprot:526068_1